MEWGAERPCPRGNLIAEPGLDGSRRQETRAGTAAAGRIRREPQTCP